MVHDGIFLYLLLSFSFSVSVYVNISHGKWKNDEGRAWNRRRYSQHLIQYAAVLENQVTWVASMSSVAHFSVTVAALTSRQLFTAVELIWLICFQRDDCQCWLHPTNCRSLSVPHRVQLADGRTGPKNSFIDYFVHCCSGGRSGWYEIQVKRCLIDLMMD